MVLFLIHLLASLYMLGVIWFVQLVHYPLMKEVAPERFPAFEEAHMRRTTWVVAPAMVLELGTGLAVWFFQLLPPWPSVLNLSLIGLLWLSTFLIQVPLHQGLRAGFDAGLHRRLVRMNWFRTLLWTLKAFLLLGLIGYAQQMAWS